MQWWRCCFASLTAGCHGGMQFGVLVEVPLCEIDGWVLGGMQFGVWGAGGGAVLRD